MMSKVITFDVYVSYAYEDARKANAACAILEAAGIRCWIAPRDVALSTTDLVASMLNAVSHSRVMVLVFSSSANQSKQFSLVREAFDKGVPVLPLCTADIPSQEWDDYYLGGLDALSPPLRTHLERFAELVKGLLKVDAKSSYAELRPVLARKTTTRPLQNLTRPSGSSRRTPTR